MVRLGDIAPDSLLKVSDQELGTFTPDPPPPIPTPTAAPMAPPAAAAAPAPVTVGAHEMASFQPLSLDDELSMEGERYWTQRNSAKNPVDDFRHQQLQPDRNLYAAQFLKDPGHREKFGVVGLGSRELSEGEKTKLLTQLRRANGVYESEMNAGTEQQGILANVAAEEAGAAGPIEAARQSFAHAVGNVTQQALVNPIAGAVGMAQGERPQDIYARQQEEIRAGRALQQAHAAANPLAAGIGSSVGAVVAPEMLAGTAITGGLAPLAAPATVLGRAGQVQAVGMALGGTVTPLQQAAEGMEVTPSTVLRDAALGGLGALGGQLGGQMIGKVAERLSPVAQGAAHFVGGAAVSGAVNTGSMAALAAVEGRDYTAADAVHDFILGTVMHVPMGLPGAMEVTRAARDRIAAADPKNSAVGRLEAEIARMALEPPPQVLTEQGQESNRRRVLQQTRDLLLAQDPNDPRAMAMDAELRPMTPDAQGLVPAEAGQLQEDAAAAGWREVEQRGGGRAGQARGEPGPDVAPFPVDEQRRAAAEARTFRGQTGTERLTPEEEAQLRADADAAEAPPAKEGEFIPDAETPDAPRTVRTIAEIEAAYPSVKLDVAEGNNSLAIGRIVVPPGERGQGVGSKVIQEIIDLADAVGKRVTLTPSTDFGGSSVPRLVKFYKRFGFIENRGAAKDFSTRDTMYREPRPVAPEISGNASNRVYTSGEATPAPTGAAPISEVNNGRQDGDFGQGPAGKVPGGVRASRGGRSGEPEAPQGIAGPDDAASAAGRQRERRKAAARGILEAIKPFRGVTVLGLENPEGDFTVVLPSRRRLPWRLQERVEVHSDHLSNYLQSARAANKGRAIFDYKGRKVKIPIDQRGWDKLTEADRDAIADRYRPHGRYLPGERAIETTYDVGDDPTIGTEEVFHALTHELSLADHDAYQRLLNRWGDEDAAFRGFKEGKSRANYFERLRKGTAHLPPGHDRKLSPRERDEARILAAGLEHGVLMSDDEFEAMNNDAGGLHPDVLEDYYVRDRDGKKVRDKKTGEFKLDAQGMRLLPYVDEDGHSNAVAGLGYEKVDQYQQRIIDEVLLTKAEKIAMVAEHFNHADAPPGLRKIARRLLGKEEATPATPPPAAPPSKAPAKKPVKGKAEPAPRPSSIAEDDIPFAVREKREGESQLTLASELRGPGISGRTGSLFGGGEERAPRKAEAYREAPLPADAEKFAVNAADVAKAVGFAEGDPSAAFTYGVKRTLAGEKLAAVKGMTTAEAKEAQRGAKAARAGMSAQQRDFIEAPAPETDRETGSLFAVREKRPGEGPGPEDPEAGKPAPNVVRSAAILAAVKTLKAADQTLYSGPPSPKEAPPRVSAEVMKEAIDQVGRDWELDPAALEKYRVPVEAAARKILSIARRQGSFDAALAYAAAPSQRDVPSETVKQTIRGSVESRDPEKIILSAKDGIRQAMRLREQGRSEGIKEMVGRQQRFLEEVRRYFEPGEREAALRELAGVGNEAELQQRLQRVYTIYERAQKRAAVEDVRDLIRGADTKHLRPEFQKAMEALTGNLDDVAMSDRTRRRAEALASYVQMLSPEERNDLPSRTLAVLERAQREPLDSFTLDELRDLSNSIRAVVTQNQLKNKLIYGKHLRDIGKTEKEVVTEVKKLHAPLGVTGKEGEKKELGDKSLPARLLEFTDSPEVMAVAAGGENGQLHGHLYEALRKAEDGTLADTRRFRGELQELLGQHKLTDQQLIDWRKKTRTVKLSKLPARPKARTEGGMDALLQAEAFANKPWVDPDVELAAIKAGKAPAEPAAAEGGARQLEITGPEALSAWLYMQNADAHEKLLANPVNLERFAGQSTENRTLLPGDLRAIEATLTPFERELGALILRQNAEMGDRIGEIHLALKGYDVPREENYFPLLTDQKQKRRALDELATKFADKWLEQSGFLQERVKHAVPVLLSDALDTHLWHLRQAISFANKALPVRNARVLLGAPGVRETIDGHVGSTWTPRMERLLKDFSGTELGARTEAEMLAGKLSRNAAAATLGLRPTTVATNFLGAPLGILTQLDAREAATFTRKWLNIKANTVDAGKYFDERIAAHNPYLADRYDPAGAHRVAALTGPEAGKSGGESPGIPSAETVAGEKWRGFQEWSLSWMNKAERAAVVAAHRALVELNPELSDAQVAERVEKIVRRTQNAVSTLDMSDFTRQTKKSPFLGLAFMFTNQAAKARDTLRLAALAYQRSNKTGADRAKLAGVLGLGVASAAIMPALVRALWGQVRNGFQEPEKRRQIDLADRLAGGVGDLADIAHPIFGDALRLISSGRNSDSINSRALAQVSQGLRGTYKAFEGLASDDPKARALLPAIYKATAALSRGAATFAGVPLDAPLTAAEGLGRLAMGPQVKETATRGSGGAGASVGGVGTAGRARRSRRRRRGGVPSFMPNLGS